MTNTAISFPRSSVIKSVLIDLFAVLFIYLIPTFSHLLALPVYFIEPMRLMVILAMVHTHRKNAYLLALTLPLFSFLISAHPSFYKTLIITGELLLNVWLFYYLLKRFGNTFAAMVSSILFSKIAYYLVKFLFINLVLVQSNLISTPIYFQVITMVVFSAYAWLIFRKKA